METSDVPVAKTATCAHTDLNHVANHRAAPLRSGVASRTDLRGQAPQVKDDRNINALHRKPSFLFLKDTFALVPARLPSCPRKAHRMLFKNFPFR